MAIGESFVCVDKPRDLPLLHVVEDFTQKSVCGFTVMAGGKIKIDGTPFAVNGAIQISLAAIDLHVRFINMTRAKIGKIRPVSARRFPFHDLSLGSAINRGMVNTDTTLG